eukprot:12285725-Alexandrium_andersonii.AAC.1
MVPGPALRASPACVTHGRRSGTWGEQATGPRVPRRPLASASATWAPLPTVGQSRSGRGNQGCATVELAEVGEGGRTHGSGEEWAPGHRSGRA